MTSPSLPPSDAGADDVDLAPTFFCCFEDGLSRSVQLWGNSASQSEIGEILSLGGRLSAFANVAASLVARRPISVKKCDEGCSKYVKYRLDVEVSLARVKLD